MKPESIKSILRSYLKERQHLSSYNDVASYLHEAPEYIPDFHGCSYAPVKHLPGVFVNQSAQPFHCAEDKDLLNMKAQSANLALDGLNDLLNQVPQYADLPLDELNVPLEPHLEALARGVGHQLNQMVNEFDANRIHVVNNQSSENGNRIIQFKELIIRVPLTCDHVQIPVIRTRAAGGVVNVTWRTCDKSAKAGLHYVNSQGRISFAQNDEEKTIEVEIIRDQERRNDIHFAVELFDAEGTFNALMVYIVDDSRLYPGENQSIQNIFNCARNISMSEIVTRLGDNVTRNIFKAALLCLSSCADSIPNKELALGAELLRLTIPHAPLSTLTNVFCEFFSYLPELEDIVSMS